MHLSALVDVIEAAYDFDAVDDVWLARLVRAAEPLVDRGPGVTAYLYDTTRVTPRV